MLGAIRENKVQGDPFRRRNSYGAPAAHLSSPSMHSTKWHPPALVATPVQPRSLFFSLAAEDWCNPLSCSGKGTKAFELGFIVYWPVSIPEIVELVRCAVSYHLRSICPSGQGLAPFSSPSLGDYPSSER